jgi:hypothetical protein
MGEATNSAREGGGQSLGRAHLELKKKKFRLWKVRLGEAEKQ